MTNTSLQEFLAGPLKCLRCGSPSIDYKSYGTQHDWCLSCSETASRQGIYRELVELRNTNAGMLRRIDRLELLWNDVTKDLPDPEG